MSSKEKVVKVLSYDGVYFRRPSWNFLKYAVVVHHGGQIQDIFDGTVYQELLFNQESEERKKLQVGDIRVCFDQYVDRQMQSYVRFSLNRKQKIRSWIQKSNLPFDYPFVNEESNKKMVKKR